MSEITTLMIYMAMIVVAIFLAVGSFLGYPGDRALGGMFWLLVAIHLILPMALDD